MPPWDAPALFAPPVVVLPNVRPNSPAFTLPLPSASS
jgi:hypothetical protein